LFEALNSTNAKTLTDLNDDRRKLRRAWNGLDPETRNTVFKYIGLLFREKTKNIIPRKTQDKPSDKEDQPSNNEPKDIEPENENANGN
jgi:hypothetical protein